MLLELLSQHFKVSFTRVNVGFLRHNVIGLLLVDGGCCLLASSLSFVREAAFPLNDVHLLLQLLAVIELDSIAAFGFKAEAAVMSHVVSFFGLLVAVRGAEHFLGCWHEVEFVK